MAEEKVRQEDVRRVGTEINQLLNQQFLITTAAITLFGAFATIATPKDRSAPFLSDFPLLCIAVASLLGVLAMLHYWNKRLGHLIASLAAYLHAADASDWEKDIQALHPDEHTGTLQWRIFQFLGLVILAWSEAILFARSHSVKLEQAGFLAAFTVVYLVLVRAREPIGVIEQRWRARWLAVIERRLSATRVAAEKPNAGTGPG